LLGTELQPMLRCIRCGACMNHCPVYQNIGGHAYGWVYPGPMGSVLTPSFVGLENALDLPNASTFCGECAVVCPVKIPLPDLLRHLRTRQVEQQLRPWQERAALRLWSWMAQRPAVYALGTGWPRVCCAFSGTETVSLSARRDRLDERTRHARAGGPDFPRYVQIPEAVMSARENILARIGKARGPAAAVDVDLAIRRRQRGPIPALDKDIVKLFGERAVKLASDVTRAGTSTEVPGLVASYLRERDLPMKGVCWPVMALLDWQDTDIEIESRAARGDDLVGITGAFLGIAETGTLMLLSGVRRGHGQPVAGDAHRRGRGRTHRLDDGAGLGPAARGTRRVAARG
jgi:ferredoxin